MAPPLFGCGLDVGLNQPAHLRSATHPNVQRVQRLAFRGRGSFCDAGITLPFHVTTYADWAGVQKKKSTLSAWTKPAPLSLFAFTEPFAVRKQQKPTAAFLSVCSFLFERDNSSPKIRCSPDAPAQGFELDDLAMIHKQIYIGTEILDVPRKYGRVSGFEH